MSNMQGGLFAAATPSNYCTSFAQRSDPMKVAFWSYFPHHLEGVIHHVNQQLSTSGPAAMPRAISTSFRAEKRSRSPIGLKTEVMDTEAGVEVRLQGHADVVEADVLEAVLLRLAARRPACVILDLSKLESISSLAMGILVAYRRGAVRAGARVCLGANLLPGVRETLESARLISLFETVDGPKLCVAPAVLEDRKPHPIEDGSKCGVGVTWPRLIELEPQLETLLWQAREAGANCRTSIDVNRNFGPVRDKLAALIGFAGRHQRHSVLGGSEAYQVAYSKLLDAVAGLVSGHASPNE
jgi:anti-anti-sigma factor